MSRELEMPILASCVEELAASSDIIVTTTPSISPVVRGALLKPGQTIIAMGSDAPHKRELDAEAFKRAAMVVCDNRAQCELLGELHHALEERAVRPDMFVVELGEIASRQKKGRTSEHDIIICDLTGMGAQDSAIGLYARRRVIAKKMGWRAPSHG
jgi:ornithine cyclodeaminase/alanine dehydrogenase-like protein (mu-crystallin family)